MAGHIPCIGIRLPAHPKAVALVAAFGGPITATSANRTGQPGCSDIAQLDPELAAGVDLFLFGIIMSSYKDRFNDFLAP